MAKKVHENHIRLTCTTMYYYADIIHMIMAMILSFYFNASWQRIKETLKIDYVFSWILIRFSGTIIANCFVRK